MMGFEYSWLLLGLPLAFALGWLASRWDWQQMRILQRSAPKTYYRGLTYLLNEQQDKAIDVFVQAVQDDPDTVELHFALGNLFRRRGEYDRAIRVHEHLLARADIPAKDRVRAQHDLALDFMKAGLFDRAEAALCKLAGTHLTQESLLSLLYLRERAQDWDAAADVTREMEKNGMGDFSGRRSHYLCEKAAAHAQQGCMDEALALLQDARKERPESLRPYAEEVQLLLQQGQKRQALDVLLQLAGSVPAVIPLVAHHIPHLAQELGELPAAQAFLAQQYRAYPSLDTLTALVAVEQALDNPDAADWYLTHEQRQPSLVAAARWMGQTAPAQSAEEQAALEQALARAQEPLMRYRCAACGFETRQYFWQCPGCQSWESLPSRRIEEL